MYVENSSVVNAFSSSKHTHKTDALLLIGLVTFMLI